MLKEVYSRKWYLGKRKRLGKYKEGSSRERRNMKIDNKTK